MYLNKIGEDLTKLINFLIMSSELRVGLSKKLKKGGNADGYRETAPVY